MNAPQHRPAQSINEQSISISGLSLESYFTKIRELLKTGESFPINIDDVWALVYSERGKAVRALKGEFIENEEFILVAQNGKQRGGHNKINYFLSVKTMEFFIARKKKEVFEVYRKIFHNAMDEAENRKPLSPAEQNLINAKLFYEHEKKIEQLEVKQSVIENKLDSLIEERNSAKSALVELPFETSEEVIPELSIRDKVRMMVNRLSRANNVSQTDIWNNIYQKLHYNYHINIKGYKKSRKNESYLEVAERVGVIDKIFNITCGLLNA